MIEDIQKMYHNNWVKFKESNAVFQAGDIGLVTAVIDDKVGIGTDFILAIAKNGNVGTENWVSYHWSNLQLLETFLKDFVDVVPEESYTDEMCKKRNGYLEAMWEFVAKQRKDAEKPLDSSIGDSQTN